MTLTIEQIRNRAEQGVTRPFLCRADDEHWYYVKGHGAGLRSLLCEWIAGRLAQAFGLPIAHFERVEVPQALIQTALRPDLWELGSGSAFGSRRHDFAQELTVSHLDLIDHAVQQDILVFDWWVHNQDRTLTEKGGNPNLLWDQGGGHVVNVSSIGGLFVMHSAAVYCATKYAVRAISEGLRMESDKVRVTCVYPGVVESELAHSITHAETAKAIDEFRQIALKPEAIAGAIAHAIAQPPEVDTTDIVVRHLRSPA